MKQALDIRAQIFGQTPPQVSVTLPFLASLAEKLGDAEQALQIQEANSDHPRTANTLFTLSRAIVSLDDPDEAIAALKRSPAIDCASRTENHSCLANSNDELAELY